MRTLLLYVTTLLLATAPSALAQDFGETEAFYRREGHSEALALRARAFFRLATAADGQGIPLLVERWRSPQGPHEEEERFLMASGLRYAGRDEATQRAIGEWLAAAKGKDAWLEYNAMLCQGEAPLLLVANDAKAPAWRRAAAITALGRGDGALEPTIAGLAALVEAGALPTKGDDLELISGALGAALVALQRRVELDPTEEPGADACAPLVQALMGLLQRPKLPEGAKRLLERRLSRFGQGAPEPADAGDEDTTRVRGGAKLADSDFMGITVKGVERLVYVIDMSDSMLAPLTERELGELKERAGRQQPSGSRARKARERLDWERIRTRFDAAREFLKLSLGELTDDAAFAVVRFGDAAELLRSTPKLVAAKPKTVARACAELDRIEPQPQEGSGRLGLFGNTNLHAAIRLAFAVSRKGVLDPEACARPSCPRDALAEAIFVLSDGAPTRDDFTGKGPEEDVDAAGSWDEVDPETGKVTRHGPREAGKGRQTHLGPYQDLEYFRPDLERLELFRWTAVHVVGIGECDRYWGQALTELGEGELQIIGSDAD